MATDVALLLRVELSPAADDAAIEAAANRLRCLEDLSGLCVAVTPVAADLLAARAPDTIDALRGAAELLTTPATDACFPLLDHDRPAMALQARTAVAVHTRVFGVAPEGIDFADGAYAPRTDEVLTAAGLRYAVVDADAIRNASSVPVYGLARPIACPLTSLAVFPRDPEARRLSPPRGAPGPFASSEERAEWDAALGAAFAAARVDQGRWLSKRMDRAPLQVAAFDLHEVTAPFLGAARGAVRLRAFAEWLYGGPALQLAWPGPSVSGGRVARITEPDASWLLRHLHAAIDRARAAAQAGEDGARSQAARLLYAQAGAWLAALDGPDAGAALTGIRAALDGAAGASS